MLLFLFINVILLWTNGKQSTDWSVDSFTTPQIHVSEYRWENQPDLTCILTGENFLTGRYGLQKQRQNWCLVCVVGRQLGLSLTARSLSACFVRSMMSHAKVMIAFYYTLVSYCIPLLSISYDFPQSCSICCQFLDWIWIHYTSHWANDVESLRRGAFWGGWCWGMGANDECVFVCMYVCVMCVRACVCVWVCVCVCLCM